MSSACGRVRSCCGLTAWLRHVMTHTHTHTHTCSDLACTRSRFHCNMYWSTCAEGRWRRSNVSRPIDGARLSAGSWHVEPVGDTLGLPLKLRDVWQLLSQLVMIGPVSGSWAGSLLPRLARDQRWETERGLCASWAPARSLVRRSAWGGEGGHAAARSVMETRADPGSDCVFEVQQWWRVWTESSLIDQCDWLSAQWSCEMILFVVAVVRSLFLIHVSDQGDYKITFDQLINLIFHISAL